MSSVALQFIVNQPPSTGITFTPAGPFTGSGTSFTATGNVASGTTVGTIAVAPSTWGGILQLSGTNASSFSLSGMNLVTAAVLAAGSTYNVTITATP